MARLADRKDASHICHFSLLMTTTYGTNMELKICKYCLLNKTTDQFSKHSLTKDRLQTYCKKCSSLRQKEYLRNNPDAREKANTRAKLWRLNNKELNNLSVQNWKDKNPIKQQLMSVRRNAKRVGVPFNLTEDDIIIPEFCPILNIKLEHNKLQAEDSSLVLTE